MKAISLWEPWASLIRTGAKTFETRHWATDHRGRLLICAARHGLPRGDLDLILCDPMFQGGLAPLVGHSLDLTGQNRWGVTVDHLNFGKAVAIVELVECRPTVGMRPEEIGANRPFGNFAPGRFAWRLNLVRRDFEPFPVKGKQGFFYVEDALIDQHLERTHA